MAWPLEPCVARLPAERRLAELAVALRLAAQREPRSAPREPRTGIASAELLDHQRAAPAVVAPQAAPAAATELMGQGALSAAQLAHFLTFGFVQVSGGPLAPTPSYM
jgi:hypothetical protein